MVELTRVRSRSWVGLWNLNSSSRMQNKIFNEPSILGERGEDDGGDEKGQESVA